MKRVQIRLGKTNLDTKRRTLDIKQIRRIKINLKFLILCELSQEVIKRPLKCKKRSSPLHSLDRRLALLSLKFLQATKNSRFIKVVEFIEVDDKEFIKMAP